MKTAALALVALGSAIYAGVWALHPEPVSCRTPVEEIVTEQYAERAGADPALTSLDIHASPHASACRVLIWVHGGSWQAGDKSTRLTRIKAEHFVSEGWIFVSINYRLASVENDVRWPDFGTDVAEAIRWTHDNIDRFGGSPEAISLIGHSAGAHLVSIVGTNESLLATQGLSLTDVHCVVSLDSVTHDLTDPPPWEVDIIDLAFPTIHDKIDGSPTLAAESLSASTTPDFLILTRGRQARLDSSARLAEPLIASGNHATVLDVSPYDHGEVSSELGMPGERRVTAPVTRFLDTCR